MKFFKFLICVVISFFTPFQMLSQITFMPNTTHVSCEGSTNGSISLSNVSGGTAPYTYTWQPGGINTSSISSQGYGNYTVSIKGSGKGAPTTTTTLNIGYKVRWQNMYNTMTQSNDTLKHGTGGSSWLYSAKSSNMLTNSTNGWVEYVIQSMDHRIFGLADSGSAVAWNTIDYAMILNAGGTYNTCNNGSQSSIGSYTVGDVMRVERNGANITYSKNGASVWTTTITSTMQQSKMFIGSAVWATGSNIANVGCSFQSVNAVAGPSMTISCSNPTVNINVYTNVASPNYSWTPGGSTPTASSTAVSSSDTYSVKVTEPYYGCNVTQTISVTSNTTIPTLTITNSPTITCSSPTVVLTSTTSTGGVTYSWSPGGATTSSLSVSTVGTYTLKATNPTNGCSITKTVSVASNTTIPTLTITNSPTITCSSPTVVLTSTTTTGGVTYSWSPGGATTSTLSVTTTGTYTLKATNPTNGCSITKTVSVVSNTVVPTLTITNSPTITCSSPTVVLTSTTSTGGVTYSWSPGGVTTSTLSVTAAGTYSLKATDPSNGCSITKTVSVVSNTVPPNVNAGIDAFVSLGTVISLGGTPTASGGSGSYSYTWAPTGASYTYTPNNSVANPTISANSTTTYTISVTDNSNGCIGVDEKLVYIINEPYYFVLKKTLDAGYYNSYNNKIYFAFEEEYYDSSNNLNYKILNDNNSIASVSPKGEQIGDNRYFIDLSSIGLSIGNFYRIVITNKKNEVFYARFKY